MLALQIKDVKHFMGKLLATELFDSFLLEEATIISYNTFHIDGRMNKEYYSNEEWEEASIRPYEFSEWKNIRPILFDLIKGKKTPVSFKFVLHLMPRFVAGVLKSADTTITAEQIRALVLTCRFEEGSLTLITGTSFHTFLLDRSVEPLWDSTIKTFLNRKEISYEEL